jgi:hypothetical protein
MNEQIASLVGADPLLYQTVNGNGVKLPRCDDDGCSGLTASIIYHHYKWRKLLYYSWCKSLLAALSLM